MTGDCVTNDIGHLANVGAMTADVAGMITTAVHGAVSARNALAVAAALNCVDPDDLATFFHASLAVEVTPHPRSARGSRHRPGPPAVGSC